MAKCRFNLAATEGMLSNVVHHAVACLTQVITDSNLLAAEGIERHRVASTGVTSAVRFTSAAEASNLAKQTQGMQAW